MFKVLAAQESGAECPAKRSRNKRIGLEEAGAVAAGLV